jgi:hypothetical protein
LATLLSAQPKLTIGETKMLIGDQSELTLIFDIPNDAQWINKDVALPDTLTALQTIQTSDPVITNTSGNKQIAKQWIVAPFDTGYIFIPQIPVIVFQNGQYDTLYSNNIPINVEGVVADSTGLAPIKDIIEESKNWIDYIWLLGAIVLFALLYTAYRFIQKRPAQQSDLPEVIRPPHEIALEKLDVLSAAKLWQKGEIKKYHSELTHVFREYLEKRYNIPALESTTEEISIDMKKAGLPQQDSDQVKELLLQSDLVKFAKAKPRIEVHDEIMQYARTFILRTKLNPNDRLEEEE